MESGQNFQRLPELHALACGLKALVTQEVAEAIDVLRRACGGHGFMASSNLPRLWGLVTAACTYEGENTVLQLQVNQLRVFKNRVIWTKFYLLLHFAKHKKPSDSPLFAQLQFQSYEKKSKIKLWIVNCSIDYKFYYFELAYVLDLALKVTSTAPIVCPS